MKQSWIDYLYGMAEYAASKSKDPNQKVGAILFRDDMSIASTGFNGFPIGANDDESLYADRNTKLLRTTHAEKNAIDFAARHGTAIDGCGIAVNYHPCSMCAASIINGGIKTVICPPIPSETKWKASFTEAARLFAECGIWVIYKEPECLNLLTTQNPLPKWELSTTPAKTELASWSQILHPL